MCRDAGFGPTVLHVTCSELPGGMVTSEQSCDMLLIGGSVVAVDDDRRVFEPGAVAIAGDRIVAVDPPTSWPVGAPRAG